ncbi:hypothetical protein NE865_00767 [Phthorimaea operculella]|nr:hypothetical protein NE865_00767 [Phthorimaea operculella]
MKLSLSFLAVILAVANCKHTFLGTNVQRPLLQHSVVKYSANVITKRIEHFHYTVPQPQQQLGKVIQAQAPQIRGEKCDIPMVETVSI